MKRFLKNHFTYIFLALVICCVIIFSNPILQNNTALADTTYSNWQQLYNSYADYSNDYSTGTLPSQYCLRDDYMIYAEQQFTLGLCWNFGSHTALETTIMKATGESLDFSEAWISTALTYADKYNYIPNYNLMSTEQYINGDGGRFVDFDLVAKKYGLVLEQDFKYEYAYEVTNGNVDNYFSLYSQYADDDIYNDYIPGRFDIDVSSKKANAIKSVKNHIINHGGITTSMKFGDSLTTTTFNSKTIIYKIPSTNVSTGHLMSIIGWDDNIQITYSGKIYKGAWIVMNSYGNEIQASCGNEGIIYVFYNDTDFTSKMWGYKYKGDTISTNLEFNDLIISSNASYSTSLCGAYYGSLQPTTKTTKQKNIFYNQPNINLTYEYQISSNSSINNITIFKGQKDVTESINITHDLSQKTINLTASNLKTGSYKVIIEYTNESTTRKHLNEFFIFDGTELSHVRIAKFSNLTYTTEYNNGQSQLYNAFDSDDNTYIYAANSSKSTDYFWFGIIFASYHSITSVSFNSNCTFNSGDYNNLATALKHNTLQLQIMYNINSLPTTYDIFLSTSTGKSKTIKLKIIKQPSSTHHLTQINYSANGGDNTVNDKKLFVSESSGATIKPITRPGYTFVGWYTSKDFSSTSKLSTDSSGNYILPYSKISKETSPTVYYTSSFGTYWGNRINVAFVYAKFEKIAYTVRFDTNGGTSIPNQSINIGGKAVRPINPTKTGYNFVGWYQDASFDNIWDFSSTVTQDITLYAKYSLKPLSSVILNIDDSNLYVGKEYTLTLNFEHELKSSASISIKWYKNNNLVTTTTTNTKKFTSNSAEHIQYYAHITLTLNGESVSDISNTISVTIIEINQISIEYTGNGKFNIVDMDNYDSTYNIYFYNQSEILATYSTLSKILDLSNYITISGTYKISVQKTYNGIILDAMHKSINIYEISYSGLSDYTNYQTILVDENYILNEPTAPTRLGLTFKYWQANGTQIAFPYTVKNNTQLVAKWDLKNITNINLYANTNQYVNTPFDLSITFDHELKDYSTISYIWYKNNSLINTSTSNILTQTLSTSGTHKFHTVIKLTFDGLTTTTTSNQIEITTIYKLSPINIDYFGNGLFKILDSDNYASNYNVSIYRQSQLIKSYDTQSKQINICDGITESGFYKISVIKSYDTVTLDLVESQNIQIVKINYTNLSDYTNYPTTFVDVGYSLQTPSLPTRLGYNFIEWQSNNNIISFPYTVNTDTTLNAIWEIKAIQNAHITTNQNQFVDHAFDLSLTFEHELISYATIQISWYKNNNLINIGQNNSINEILTASGDYSYYAIIKLSYGQDSTTATTDILIVTATFNLSPITIKYNSNGIFEIVDNDKYASNYQVTEYFNNSQIKSYSTQNKIIDINETITTFGQYQISVIKSFDNINLDKINSATIEIVQISYTNLPDTTNHPTQLVDKGYTLNQPTTPNKLGYDFVGWTIDNVSISFPYEINQNIILFANWKLKNLENITLTAQTTQLVDSPFNLTLSFVHELMDSCNLSIEWFRDNKFIATTQTLLLTETLTKSGQYVYSAKITIFADNESTYAFSNSLTITATYELATISINYNLNGIFEIIDIDSFNSTYEITEYHNGQNIKKYSTQDKFINISESITDFGKYKISVIKKFENSQVDEVVSEEIEIVKLEYANLVDYKNYQTIFVDLGYELNEPAVPKKLGYNFVGWNINFTQVNFPYTLTTNTCLNAEWELKEIQSLTIMASPNQFVNHPFDITLSFEHDLKDIAEININWYRNNNHINTTSNTILNENSLTSGEFEYYAVVALTHENNTVSSQSNIILINIIYKLAEISIKYLGNYQFEIIDPDDYDSLYTLTIYLNNNIMNSSITNKKQISIEANVNQKGNYKIGLIKSFDGQNLPEKYSNIIEVYEINIIKNISVSSKIKTIYQEKNTYINDIQNIIENGYTFVGWFLDNNNSKPCQFPMLVQSDMEIFGKLKLKNVNIDCITELQFVYDQQNHTITPIVSHELDGGQFMFSWKKQNDNNFTLQNQTLTVKNVADSGIYYCNVSYEYNGDIANSKTNNITVNISKAPTILSTLEMQKEYTYDGQTYTINSGATVDRQNELPNIVYSNNTFTDVPTNNVLRVKIVAQATENYSSSTTYQDIFVNKAQSSITANSNQTFTYCKQKITPNFELNNNQQEIQFSQDIINVGQYDMIVSALESKNYLPCQKLISITINPANITIKVKDVTSLWLFGLQEFDYEVTQGQIFDGDNINEEYLCDATNSTIGTFKITMTASNSNYNIEIIDGTYTITALPHFIVGIMLVILLATIIIIHIIRKNKIKNTTAIGLSFANSIQTQNNLIDDNKPKQTANTTSSNLNIKQHNNNSNNIIPPKKPPQKPGK